MKRFYSIAASAAFAVLLIAAPSRAADIPADVAAAVADAARPAEDTARDANRKPAEVLAFADIKAGDRVVDVAPGEGYYTRMLSRIVGADGAVIAFNPDWVLAKFPDAADAINALPGAGYANVTTLVAPPGAPGFGEPVDVIFLSLFYHDGHWQKIDVAASNRAYFDALKPGGTFIVIDHVAEAGSGTRDAGTLHRIDPEVIKAEVTAAGFVFESESDVLRNPADPHTDNVFGEIRGKTDQVIYKFRKPAG